MAKRRVIRLVTGEMGSFTVEASLILPVIFLLTVALLFMGIYLYEKAGLYGTASVTAERTAFTWDNSHKNPVTGTYSIRENDGLYWRTLDDNLWNLASNDLPKQKLKRASGTVSEGIMTDPEYSNGILKRMVTVKLQSAVKAPFVMAIMNRTHIRAEAVSFVTDPAEFIRNVDLARTYFPVVKDRLSQLDLMSLFSKFHSKKVDKPADSKLAFRQELDARKYLQEQVGGKEVNISLPAGKWRKIDALDKDGIAHQAYLGYIRNGNTITGKSENIVEQLNKDLLLLQEGTIKGIIWHFYRRAGSEEIGLSKPLRKELEKKGVIVVIHDE